MSFHYAYKGFAPDLTCRGFQFEPNKTYVHEGEVKICESGFHSCKNPLDIFTYYPPANSVYRHVIATGETAEHHGDSKLVSSILTIGASLDIAKLIDTAISFITDRCLSENQISSITPNFVCCSSISQAFSSATGGGNSISCTTGTSSSSYATKEKSISCTSGSASASKSIGDRSISCATGSDSVSSAFGDRILSGITGYKSASNAHGYRVISSATGDASASSAIGLKSISSTTGDWSLSTSAGEWSLSVASGDISASRASGNGSISMTIGNDSRASIDSTLNDAIALGLGYSNKAKAPLGSAIVLAHRTFTGRLVHIRASMVGENGIEPDVFYSLNENGEFVRENQGA